MSASNEESASGGDHASMAMPDRYDGPTATPGDHASMATPDGDEMGMNMRPRATRPQIVVVAIMTVVALIAALAYSASKVNLRIAGADVKNVVMPPGMIMTNDMPAQAMRDMSAVNPDDVTYTADAGERGDRILEGKVDNGVRVFNLEASVIEWNILHDKQVMAYAFNRQVPGPRIQITEGDDIRINVTNNLPDATSVHWHGLILPNAMDGPGDVTQTPIQPGQTFTYEFIAIQAGTFFYHSHTDADRQQALGMYGALIIDPRTTPATRATTTTPTIPFNSRSGQPSRATHSRRCRWKGPCPTTSPSTARHTPTPTRSKQRSETASGSASSAATPRSSTPCTSTAARSR